MAKQWSINKYSVNVSWDTTEEASVSLSIVLALAFYSLVFTVDFPTTLNCKDSIKAFLDQFKQFDNYHPKNPNLIYSSESKSWMPFSIDISDWIIAMKFWPDIGIKPITQNFKAQKCHYM